MNQPVVELRVDQTAARNDRLARHKQNAGSFWGRNQKGYTLMHESLKMAIVNAGAVVEVLAVRDGVSKWGPTWFADVELNGVRWTIPFSHNQLRDQMLVNMAVQIVETGESIPAGLQEFQAEKGPGWDFCPPPDRYWECLESGEVFEPNEATRGAAAMTAWAEQGFDDVPF